MLNLKNISVIVLLITLLTGCAGNGYYQGNSRGEESSHSHSH
jgi:hypothetical protein